MKLYLICHYGGYLAFNTQTNTLVSSPFFNNEILPLIYHEDEIKIEVNNQLFAFNWLNNPIEVIPLSGFIKIKIKSQFLIQQKDKSIVLSPQSLLAENQFILTSDINYLCNNAAFISDCYYLNANRESTTHTIPNTIWIYWEQAEKSQFLQQCEKRIRQLNKTSTIFYLNKENLSEHLDQAFLNQIFKADISPTLRSDLIRLKLLYEYGGIWLDASIILNDSIENILQLEKRNCYELTCFYMETNWKNNYPNAKYPIFESWFLATPKHSAYIKKWLDLLLPVTETGVMNLAENLMTYPFYEQIKRNFNPYYYLVYTTQQIALFELNGEINIKAYCAENSAFYFQMQSYTRNGYTHFSAFNELVTQSAEQFTYLPKLIKFAHIDRQSLEKIKHLNYCTQNSFLYDFLYP